MLWVIGVIIVIFLCVYFKKVYELQKTCGNLAETRMILSKIIKERTLPTVNTHIILKPDEEAYFVGNVQLCEVRAARRHNNFFVGSRATRRIFVGGSTGVSRSFDELRNIDKGSFVLTNKRIVFDGAFGSRNVPLNKIISVKRGGLSELEVAIEGKEKSQIYKNFSNSLLLQHLINIILKFQLYSLSGQELTSEQVEELIQLEDELGNLERDAQEKLSRIKFPKHVKNNADFKIIPCGSCGQKLRFPNKSLRVTCPKCGASFKN